MFADAEVLFSSIYTQFAIVYRGRLEDGVELLASLIAWRRLPKQGEDSLTRNRRSCRAAPP
jgi:hypothetical protein